MNTHKSHGGWTRRGFISRASAGLLGAALMGASAAATAVPEFKRGGMIYRRLGQTDLNLSLLSFGSHTDPADRVRLGKGKTALTEAGQARRDQIIDRALDLGVNLLDVYDSEGQWEPAARLLRQKRDKVMVSLAHDVSIGNIDRACRLFGHVDLFRLHTAEIDSETLEAWDVLRCAKEAGKIRAIGIASHIERTLLSALRELDDLDFFFFPYNFIHARGDYSELLPEAARRQVGLIAMKPLASGSIVKLDPRAKLETAPEFENIELWQQRNKPVLPAAVAELTKSLGRMPDETLCMAAMRFVYGRPFISTAITGMFEARCLDENYRALANHEKYRTEQQAALHAAERYASLLGSSWLPAHYRWLEEQWRA